MPSDLPGEEYDPSDGLVVFEQAQKKIQERSKNQVFIIYSLANDTNTINLVFFFSRNKFHL